MKRETIMWVCKLCVQQKRSPATRYEDTGGTKNMIAHLQEKHSIDKNGLVKKRKHEVFTKHGESIEQARRNRHVEGFKPRIFKRAMIRWIAHNNIAHVQVESDAFRDMMFEANPGLEKPVVYLLQRQYESGQQPTLIYLVIKQLVFFPMYRTTFISHSICGLRIMVWV